MVTDTTDTLSDPIVYAEKRLGITFTEDQIQAIRLLQTPPYKLLLGTGHSVGKSLLAAVLISWWFDRFRESSCVISTAPTRKSVEDILWREVRRLRRRAGLGGFTGTRKAEMYDNEDHFAMGYTANKGEAWAGRHLEHMLFLFDEATGIEDEFYTVTASMFVPDGNHLWLCGFNPVDTTSAVFQAQQTLDLDGKSAWHSFSLSSLNHPNVLADLAGKERPVPGAVTLSQVNSWFSEWTDPVPKGQETAEDLEWPPKSGRFYRPGPEFLARCMGVWPSAGGYSIWSDSLWKTVTKPRECCQGRAFCRECLRCLADALPEIGCDPAADGPDYTAIGSRWGRHLLHAERHNGWDAQQTVGRLKELARDVAAFATLLRPPTAAPVLPNQIVCKIDRDGLGKTGVVDWANPRWRNDFTFIGLSGASRPVQNSPVRPLTSGQTYLNLRAEIWFNSVILAKTGRMDLSALTSEQQQRFRREALAPKWKLDGLGRRVVEPKIEMKKRLPSLGSPDNLDMLNLLYFDVPSFLPTAQNETGDRPEGFFGQQEADEPIVRRPQGFYGGKFR